MTMCKIAVIFSIFYIFENLNNVSVTRTEQTQNHKLEPYVLAEYVDQSSLNHHYEVPSCIVGDTYSATGDSYTIKYMCFPITVDQCAEYEGNFRNYYCLFENKPDCGVEGNYEYVIEYELDSQGDQIRCSGKEDDTETLLYRVGYTFVFAEGDRANVDIYRFCYNKITKKMLYSEYKIISPNLLGTSVDNKSYSRKIENLYLDNTGLLGDFTDKYALFQQVNTDVEGSSRVESLIVPPEHMAFDWWKAPLFHIVNAQLLRTGPNYHSYMNTINNHIRDKAKEVMGEIFIRAGVFNISDDVFDAYIWWKLIYNEKQTHAIALIIHNELTPPKTKICGDWDVCKNNGWENLVPPSRRGFIYCCPPDYIVDQFHFTPVEILNLPGLNKEVYEGKNQNC